MDDESATLRDRFAMSALAVLAGRPASGYAEMVAEKAYEIADAMLRERKKK